MDLHKLRVFREVVERGSFTAAAEALLLSQPLVSSHIKDLETYYGVHLFDRANRQIRLTEAGVILDRYARQILNAAREAQQALNDYNGLAQGELVVGASTTPGVSGISPRTSVHTASLISARNTSITAGTSVQMISSRLFP